MRPLLPVLMTASVDTRGMKGALFAAAEREKMYVETVRYYLDTICRDPRQKIVFCDNSGWDLASLRAKVGRPSDAVEWLSLDPNDFDISRGKGYKDVIDRFPREPHYGGQAGHAHNGGWTWSADHDCPLERAKRLVGNFIRIFLPGLKF